MGGLFLPAAEIETKAFTTYLRVRRNETPRPSPHSVYSAGVCPITTRLALERPSSSPLPSLL